MQKGGTNWISDRKQSYRRLWESGFVKTKCEMNVPKIGQRIGRQNYGSTRTADRGRNAQNVKQNSSL
ncbi:hypothetical protein Hanom_Chr16g01425111 [Helianthus anomalus]